MHPAQINTGMARRCAARMQCLPRAQSVICHVLSVMRRIRVSAAGGP